jgi:hypothetical protein
VYVVESGAFTQWAMGDCLVSYYMYILLPSGVNIYRVLHNSQFTYVTGAIVDVVVLLHICYLVCVYTWPTVIRTSSVYFHIPLCTMHQ